ncbi:MAG TPA: PEP/pyruvate-binding domain-containing protein [Steroidobacteraceae bacterium]|nr:PEP/pyruvate-binding domain-containing protein [Steroidobacteraceae bacterium]
MNSAILDWDAVLKAGAGATGSKAWRLALMRELGLRVPDAFVVSPEAFRGRTPNDAIGTDIVDGIWCEIDRRGWGESSLALRSSATHEDSVAHSFAGIYQSVLDVRGRACIHSALQQVLDSYWSTQACAYRERAHISCKDGAMAVIVMPMLRPVAAGVVFTCDPVTGREDRIVINATRGLADALVNAQVPGDEYVLSQNHRNLDVMQMRPCDASTALSNAQALQLGRLAGEIADALDYTRPFFDIEWVWDGKDFWIVQARPITARAHATYPQLANQPVLWSRANSKEVVPHAFAALDWSIAQPLLQRMLTCTARLAGYQPRAGIRRTMLRCGRLYYETSIMQWESFDAFDVPPSAYNRLLGGNQPEISLPKSSVRDRLARASRSTLFLLRSIRPRMRAAESIRRAHDGAIARARAILPNSARELANLIGEQIEALLQSEDLFLLQAAGSALYLLTDALKKQCGDEAYSLAAALMTGGEPSITAVQNLRLMQLANFAADDSRVLDWLRNIERSNERWRDELPEGGFRDSFLSFLDDFGHRAVYESYLRSPRWSEDPSYLFDVILSLAGIASDQVDRRKNDLLAQADQRLRRIAPFWMRPTLHLLARLAQSERRMREGARSALTAQLGVIRRLVLQLARCLQDEAGFIDSADLFHLTRSELYAFANAEIPLSTARSRALWRRKQFDDFSNESESDVVIENARASTFPREPAQGRQSIHIDCQEWFGTVLAAGFARGMAHVARHPTEAANLQPGAILVAPATDPAWTPLFLKAAAVVVEVGGYVSHSAIVAREFGIPAISNVSGIVSRISNGDVLEVDGDRGCVRLINKACFPTC